MRYSGAADRPHRSHDEFGLSRVGQRDRGRAGKPVRPASDPRQRKTIWRRKPADVVPGAARRGRWSGRRRGHEHHREGGILHRARGIAPATIKRVLRRPRRACDLCCRRLGQELHLTSQVVVTVAEQVGGHRSGHERRAEEEESENQQRRDDPDEDVRKDQLSPDAPEKATLNEEDEPGQKEENGKRQPDRRGCAEDAKNRWQVAEEPEDGDENLEGGGNDEQPAGPGVQQEVARRATRLLWRHR